MQNNAALKLLNRRSAVISSICRVSPILPTLVCSPESSKAVDKTTMSVIDAARDDIKKLIKEDPSKGPVSAIECHKLQVASNMSELQLLFVHFIFTIN
jgi:hypothetical protein